ncbi:uncharacterized protein MONOS_3406 [Monocercomonoides exilis]|uniref:uncharacterized protein n=1 Tax=Monocercomonoides exilis TaxID=2049356 RepID=UPI0035594969|nr:hypothetical protein MONOS_3406 [Monocercomonoides exilis]|eukprot:MONOS_3406.1-p1 / transcript=MONOS_3406.1 / gene=MONOS_3406 / organism=Monocercomonoides_exilis_PA203 / gene_product=unspecified product / transcript_product=unspecified product / location=Mono_scaffold00080:40375-43522(-) / protein_length=907 / sequence_SO=supercontig / SO=protein_coding / is_pseudo=false
MLLLVIPLLSLVILPYLQSEPITGGWEKTKPTIKGFHGHAAVVENNLIYIVGGNDGTAMNTEVIVLNIDGTLNKKIELDGNVNSRTDHTFTRVADGGIMIGGSNNNDYYGDVWLLDFSSLEWRNLGEVDEGLKLSRHSAAANADGTLLVIWGGESAPNTPSNKLYVGYPDAHSKKWLFTNIYFDSNTAYPPAVNTEITFWQKVGKQNIFYVSGGKNEQYGHRPSLFKLILTDDGDTFTAVFEEVYVQPDGLRAREQHFATIFGSSLFLFGGTTGSSVIEKINLIDNSWYELEYPSGVIPPPLTDFASVQLEDSPMFIVIGGYDSSNLEDETQVSSDMWTYKFDSCYQSIDCATCAQDANCGWCSTKHTCISVKNNSPQYETCSFVAYTAMECPGDCEGATFCEVCLRQRGCGWCQQTYAYPKPFAGCMPGNVAGPTLGSCGSWAYSPSSPDATCVDVKPVLHMVNPDPVNNKKLSAGDSMLLEWKFSSSVYGFIDCYAVVYKKGEPSETEVLLQKFVAADYPWMFVTIPASDPDSFLKFRFYVYCTGSKARVAYDSDEYELFTPNMKVTAPAQGEVVYGPDPYKVKFDRDGYVGGVTVSLYSAQDMKTPLQVISHWTEDSEVEWKMEAKLPSAEDYVIGIHQAATGTMFCRSYLFTYITENIHLVIEEPKEGALLPAGEDVVIKWSCKESTNSLTINLYELDNAGARHKVKNITDNVKASDKQFTWAAIVPESSDKYMISVQDVITKNEAKVGGLRINAISLSIDIASAKKTRSVKEEEIVVIEWEWSGKRTEKDLYLYNSSSSAAMRLTHVDADATSVRWQVPSGLGKAKSTKGTQEQYYIEIETAWMSHTARSPSFTIIQPGSVPTKSVAAVVVLVIFTLAVVGVLVLLFFFVFRKRMAGFTSVA